MKNTKERNEGVGANLYGIPLDDILSEEQIEQVRQEKLKAARKNSKRRRKRREKRKKAIAIPQFKLTNSARYTLITAIAVSVLFMIFHNLLSAWITPKTYVSRAFEATLSRLEKGVEKSVEHIFGFNPFLENELTITVKEDIEKDSLGNMGGFSGNIQLAYSDKSKNVLSVWQGVHNGEQFVTGSAYLNNDEVGFCMPEVFGEYWIAPTKTFGKEWNESGLRKALYADTLGEDANISFDKIFGKHEFLSDVSLKQLTKLTDRFISDSRARYGGKEKITVDGKERKGRRFSLVFKPEDVKNYGIAVLDVFENDEELAGYMSSFGMYDEVMANIDDLLGRLEGTISIMDAEISFVEYKEAMVKADFHINYIENNMPTDLEFSFLSSDEDIIDSVSVAAVSKGGKNYEYSFSSVGNHMGKGKGYSDTAVLKIISDTSGLCFESNINLDYKEKTASGTLTVTNGGDTHKVTYSGACSKKKGFSIDLKDVAIETIGSANRNISGGFSFAINTGMKISKVNPVNKKQILELNKSEAENYIKKLEETDSVKNYLAKKEEIFGVIPE